MTGNVPRALSDRPGLKQEHRHLLSAFYGLSAGRAYGEVPQPIQAAEVLAYCGLMGIRETAERERLYSVIRHLDTVFLNHVIEKQEQARELAKGPAP